MYRLRPTLKISMLVILVGWLNAINGTSAAGAEIELTNWRYSKPIELAGAARYQAFYLDKEVYAGANSNLSDLRVMDASGDIVPYYVDSGYGETIEQSEMYSEALKYSIEQFDRYTNVIVHNPDRLKIKRLQLDIEGNLKRSYAIFDADNKLIDSAGANELYRFDFKEVPIANTSITLSKPMSSTEFTIRINNEDNPPLKINGLNAEYFIDKLVFEDQGNSPYRLFFGNREAKTPSYDIVSFKAHIEKEAITLGKLGAQTIHAGTTSDSAETAWYQSKAWFNAVIVSVALVLIVFIAIKLRRPNND